MIENALGRTRQLWREEVMTPLTLQQENRQCCGRDGVSTENASLGLQPAFTLYEPCFPS
jgi:hypothetical protein